MNRTLMSQQQNKYLSTLIVTVGAFLGFEALSYAIGIYQLKSSLYLSFIIYAFHVFWLTFIFDLHLKKVSVIGSYLAGKLSWPLLKAALSDRFAHVRNWHYFRHFQNYLVLPGIIYWSAVVLMFLNPFKQPLKQVILLTATFAMAVAYWFMKEHVSRRLEHDVRWIKILAMVKLIAAFLVYSATLGVTFYLGLDVEFLFLSTMTVTFLLVYQALFQHRLLNFDMLLSTVIISFVIGLVAVWVYYNWTTQYLTGGLVMLAVYNALWGMLHHYLDHNLTRRVMFEYLAMMVLIISFLLASHNFGQRVI